MIKTFLTFLLLCLFITTQAQIPSGYYNNAYDGANAKICATLKTALYNIVSANTNVLEYSSNSVYDTWDAINSIDTIRNDANTAFRIWDMYTDNPTGPELYTFIPVTNQCGNYNSIGDCYNREHSFPQSWFGGVLPMLSDMHHVFASDGFINGKHENFPYGEVNPSAVVWSSNTGVKLGTSNYGGYTGRVFEPIDAYKGDFARAMFYMVTRYETNMAAWQSNGNANEVLDGTTWPSIDNWAIKQWYKWHLIDPVSPKEIIRNNKIYAFQNNRNPFIDHPEYVALIWQCTNLLPVTLVNFSAVQVKNVVTLKWTVVKETNFKQYEVERSTDGLHFSSIAVANAVNKTTYWVNDVKLPVSATVFYRLKMLDIDGEFEYSKTISVKIKKNSSSISVFPNPAKNVITIKLEQQLSTNSIIKITDIAGREVVGHQTIIAGQIATSIKINHLPAGRYVVAVIANKNETHESFVIIK